MECVKTYTERTLDPRHATKLVLVPEISLARLFLVQFSEVSCQQYNQHDVSLDSER